ncbi:hypothetical protein M0R01_01745 [bacterium]|nr:hypothetical protein [bacterium]
MDLCSDLIEKLVESIQDDPLVNAAEIVAIALLKEGDVKSAIYLAKNNFLSFSFVLTLAKEIFPVFCSGLVTVDDFVLVKKIVKMNIASEEADFILGYYIGPNGRYSENYYDVPAEILHFASYDKIIHFFEFVLEHKGCSGVKYIKKILASTGVDFFDVPI